MPKGVYVRKPRSPKQHPAELVAAIDEMYSAGNTQAEVGVLLGLSQKVVHSIMRRHSIQARIAAKRDQWGENNSAWKGSEAGYQALHRRLYARHGKPVQCSQCGTTEAEHYDYANLTGRYEDLSDYAPMCRSCHWKYDKKILNIAHMREAIDA